MNTRSEENVCWYLIVWYLFCSPCNLLPRSLYSDLIILNGFCNTSCKQHLWSTILCIWNKNHLTCIQTISNKPCPLRIFLCTFFFVSNDKMWVLPLMFYLFCGFCILANASVWKNDNVTELLIIYAARFTAKDWKQLQNELNGLKLKENRSRLKMCLYSW